MLSFFVVVENLYKSTKVEDWLNRTACKLMKCTESVHDFKLKKNINYTVTGCLSLHLSYSYKGFTRGISSEARTWTSNLNLRYSWPSNFHVTSGMSCYSNTKLWTISLALTMYQTIWNTAKLECYKWLKNQKLKAVSWYGNKAVP